MKKSLVKQGLAVSLFSGFAAFAALNCAPAQAGVVVSYPNFSGQCGTASLTCVGDASSVGNNLQITPANYGQSGAAYSTDAITLGTNATFSSTFQFQFTNAGGEVGSPADGITFVLAASPTGLGSPGGQLGYGGVQNSVAIAFDTYNNGTNDGNSSNHVDVSMDGHMADGTALSEQGLTNVYGISTCDFNSATINTRMGCMSNGDIWTATVGYDGTDLSLTLQDANNPVDTIYDNFAINIGSFLGTNTAYVGFTGGTGLGYEQQDVLNWQFADDTSLAPPAVVPEPSSLALLGIAMLGLYLNRRRCS